MQTKTSRVFLMLAVVLGVLATVTTFAFLESSTGRDRGPKVTILAANRDLKPNAPLDPDKDLVELEIPARLTELRQRALLPQNKAAYKGERVNRRILAGTPVMLADLRPLADVQLSNPDARALSIPVRGANAVSGLLSPGDWVKIYVTRPLMRVRNIPPAGGEGDPPVPTVEPAARWDTVMILPQAVRVLAIGLRSRRQLTAAEQYDSAGESESSQTVTLEVTEAQVKTILELTGAGQLPVTLILCPPSSTAPAR